MSHVEMELPSYLTALSSETIDAITRYDDERVIAAGVHPGDSSLVFVTNKLVALYVKPNGNLVPATAYPGPDGKAMMVTFRGHTGTFVIDSALAAAVGVPCLEGGELFVNDKFICKVGS